MNEEEAKKVLEIMANADGGCPFCARELFLQFIKEFPDFTGLTEAIFKEKFEEELMNEENR